MAGLYDHIGSDYDVRRQADPYLVSCKARLLELAVTGVYLDVGCGTGNYTVALAQRAAS